MFQIFCIPQSHSDRNFLIYAAKKMKDETRNRSKRNGGLDKSIINPENVRMCFSKTIMLYCCVIRSPHDAFRQNKTAGLSQHYSETVKACEMQNFFKKGEGLKLCT